MRSLADSAEITREVEISTLSAHQIPPAGVFAHSSSWTPADHESEERNLTCRNLLDKPSVFLEFGSLYFMTLRRPWCRLLRQRQSIPSQTLRRPSG